LVGALSRCVQAVDSFNVVQPTFIDAVFLWQRRASEKVLIRKLSRAKKQNTARKKQGAPDDAGAPRFVLLFLLLASLRRRSVGSLGRRVHRRLVGADVTEQDRAVRQILFHQAGAGRGDRARSNSVARNRVVVAPAVPTHVPMAVTVEVEAMPVEVAVPVMEVNVPVVPVVVMVTVVTVTMMVVMTMVTVTRTVVTMTMTVTVAVTAVAGMTATVTMAAMAAGISRRRDERRQANDGRGDESEECSALEHCKRPFHFGSR
jgi:hypothetical protein